MNELQFEQKVKILQRRRSRRVKFKISKRVQRPAFFDSNSIALHVQIESVEFKNSWESIKEWDTCKISAEIY